MADNPKHVCPVTDAYCSDKFQLTVEHEPGGVAIHVPNYGTNDMEPGAGPVVFVEMRKGVPHVLIWGNIQQEEPTHIISLAHAAECFRTN